MKAFVSVDVNVNVKRRREEVVYLIFLFGFYFSIDFFVVKTCELRRGRVEFNLEASFE